MSFFFCNFAAVLEFNVEIESKSSRKRVVNDPVVPEPRSLGLEEMENII